MNILESIKNFFSKFFKKAVQDQLDIIIPIARDAIRMVANDPSIITSDEKRARAVSIIIAKLTEQELTFAKRLVNLAVEIAVVELKGIS